MIVILEPDPETKNDWLVRIDSTKYAYSGKYKALPDAKIHIQFENGRTRLAGITLQYRGEAPQRFIPADEGPWSEWAHAKRVARMAANVHGQVGSHLVRGHLVGELVQVAVSRTLDHHHPLAQLLKPHVDGTAGINNLGEDIIVGEKGAIVRCSALSNEGVLEFVGDTMGCLDWKGFSPRKPLFGGHIFAEAQQTFWMQLRAYVDKFFAQSDPQNWSPSERAAAQRFADELIRNSMAAKQTEEGLSRFRAEERSELPLPATVSTRSTNGLNEPAALHPIDPQSSEDWRQFCAWVIHHVSFVHCWSNDGMIYDNGHMIHGPLGLKKIGTPSNESEFWRSYAIDSEDASFQLLLVEILSRTRWLNLGYQDEGPSERIPFSVRAHFGEPSFSGKMRSLHFDPARIRARANI